MQWIINYSTNKEDRAAAIITAGSYTEAYLLFSISNKNIYIVEIKKI